MIAKLKPMRRYLPSYGEAREIVEAFVGGRLPKTMGYDQRVRCAVQGVFGGGDYQLGLVHMAQTALAREIDKDRIREELAEALHFLDDISDIDMNGHANVAMKAQIHVRQALDRLEVL